MENRKNSDFMRTRPVLPLLLSMSIPMVISMLVSSLYNIVDSYFVAAISEEAMLSLSLVFPMQNAVHSAAVGFGVGVNAAIAFHLGAGDKDRADAAMSTGVVLSVLHGIILMAACIAASRPFLSMFTSSESVISMGTRYSSIVFAFALVDIPGITMEKVFQSVGRMKVSMAAMMAGCIANIILDPLMIFGIGPFPAMGIEGAALATGIGQTLTLLIYIAVYAFSPIDVRFRWNRAMRDRSIAMRLYSVGIPATLSMAIPSLLVSALNALLAMYSGVYTLILGIYYKLQTFLYLPASGFVQGMRPLIGYNYGAGDMGRVRRIFLLVTLMCLLIMLLGTVLCMLFPEALIALFTSNPETIGKGAAALRIISLGFMVSAVSVAASGALEGLGMGLPSLVISLLRYALIIIPLSYFLCLLTPLGPEGVWHSFWMTEAIAAIVSIFIYRRSIRGR